MNAGQLLAPEMVEHNLIGTVGVDETYAYAMSVQPRAAMYVAGAVEGTPEIKLRSVFLNLSHQRAILWRPAGGAPWTAGAIVPEHIKKLKAWDLVEFRNVGTYRTIEDFVSKKEGNIIVRVLCRRADSDYEKCRDALPQQNGYPNGQTGTPYPISIKEYGYTYTPAYDDKGKLTRVIPEYVPRKPL
jgi:hypothetical protein